MLPIEVPEAFAHHFTSVGIRAFVLMSNEWSGTSRVRVEAAQLTPSDHIRRTFGFPEHVLMVQHTSSLLADWVIRECERIPKQFELESQPTSRHDTHIVGATGKGEEENAMEEAAHPQVILHLADATDIVTVCRSFRERNPECALHIGFVAQNVLSQRLNWWFVPDELSRCISYRSAFDDKLPLKNDTNFFGRAATILQVIEELSNGHNVGIFGLRKMGKTSLLYKIQRALSTRRNIRTILIDCKSPKIRKRGWTELLWILVRELTGEKNNKPSRPTQVVEAFEDAVNTFLTAHRKRAIFIFDELEFISHVAKLDPHWNTDFVHFWQTIWAYQSEHRNISILVAGVSPSPVESAYVAGVQNPLFSLFKEIFLEGMSTHETKQMIQKLGTQVGLQFSDDACQHLCERYGGHPLLMRLVCGVALRSIIDSGIPRPCPVDASFLSSRSAEIALDLRYYPESILGELRQYYPDEYDVLAMLARGKVRDFIELEGDSLYSAHLKKYGLIGTDPKSGLPCVSTKLLEWWIRYQERRGEPDGLVTDVAPVAKRERWLAQRLAEIVRELRALDSQIRANNTHLIFGESGRFILERITYLTVVHDQVTFKDFISAMNKCIVEPIELFGKSSSRPRDFFWDVCKEYPALGFALKRVKFYRHEQVHLDEGLNEHVVQQLKEYFKHDLNGAQETHVDYWFLRQHVVIDGLVSAIHVELARGA